VLFVQSCVTLAYHSVTYLMYAPLLFAARALLWTKIPA